MNISDQDIYRLVFKEYPDVMDISQVSKLLGVSTKTVYKLIRGGSLSAMKVGRSYRVPKVTLMKEMRVFGSTVAMQTI